MNLVKLSYAISNNLEYHIHKLNYTKLDIAGVSTKNMVWNNACPSSREDNNA